MPEQEDLEISQISARYTALALVWEIIKIVIIALVIIVPIRAYVVQPFFVNGASMEDTFHDGDYILIDKVSYDFHDPRRGDVIVFEYPNDRSQYFVKRIVGLPGETVQIKNNSVKIFNNDRPDGFTLAEPYLEPGEETKGNLTVVLDPNEYYVLGDNRPRSSDSRYWGPVNSALISGRVWVRAWPLQKATVVHAPQF